MMFGFPSSEDKKAAHLGGFIINFWLYEPSQRLVSH